MLYTPQVCPGSALILATEPESQNQGGAMAAEAAFPWESVTSDCFPPSLWLREQLVRPGEP